MKQRDIIPKIRTVLKKVIPNAEVILYGSVARGEETEESDIDLLILVDEDKLTYDDKGKIIQNLDNLEAKTGVAISPVIRTRTEWQNVPFRTPFMINVINEGIRL
ncbi:MAG: nucleotidyltransferase domain-containing protein [Candidatus Symbiothrix sp.]|jgi:predicted nucleotidyltransferase|nr:nucleotidyltransferase domain-containing protein [Candidatus Symbiothrix sp.]